ncbi:MAG: metal ABC transporter substrate-binding protein [Actinomycetia bacterium]|nr:metal ABC transporter substrate-binding protein [Actinomycetes bacterium]
MKPVGKSVALAALASAMTLISTAGCASSSEHSVPGNDLVTDDDPVIVTSFYPIQWLASELVADKAEVISLTPEGTEPHDLALNASAQKVLAHADVVLYLGADFQPDVERAIGELEPAITSVDLLTAPGVRLLGVDHTDKEAHGSSTDPHVWLSPIEMIAMADASAEAITSGAPELADQVATNLPDVRAKLQMLDADYRNGLTNCASRVLVTSHAAFGYLADEYGLQQVPISGLNPEHEPDPKTLQATADLARAKDVQTVFFEETLPADLARTVAEEIGARTSLLAALEFDPRGSLGPDEDYVSVMSGNLDRIEDGLGCAAAE